MRDFKIRPLHRQRNRRRKPAQVLDHDELAELLGVGLNFEDRRANAKRSGGVNSDVIALSQRFAMLMAEYQQSMEDGQISVNEAKRLLRETTMLQQVLVDMKLNLEDESN